MSMDHKAHNNRVDRTKTKMTTTTTDGRRDDRQRVQRLEEEKKKKKEEEEVVDKKTAPLPRPTERATRRAQWLCSRIAFVRFKKPRTKAVAATIAQGEDEPEVFKKQSPNSRLTLYLSSREFVHLSNEKVTSIDGVVLVESNYVGNRCVFAMVVLNFRYGREDEEVMGLKFYTEAILDYKQVYPETSEQTQSEELTPLQINLMRKLGAEAFPFTLRVTPKAPPSVRLHPARPYVGAPLGVSYDLRVFMADKNYDKPHKRNMVRMALRTVEYAEELIRNPCNRPSIDITKHFVLSSGKLQIQAILDKELYQQGDPLHVHITIDNSTRTKTVHRLKVSVLQHVNVCMFTHGRFKNIIGTGGAGTSSVPPMSHAQRDFVVVLDKCEKFPVALAVESDFSHDDPSQYNLSSTTALIDPREKNPYGVSVQYEVKIKALLGCLDRPIVVRIPFKIMAVRKEDYSTRTLMPINHDSHNCQRDRKLSQQFPYALLNSAEFVSQELHSQRAPNTSPSPPQSPRTSRPSIVVIEEQRVRNRRGSPAHSEGSPDSPHKSHDPRKTS
ncbi:phosrestin-2-like [Galendromus occidentalis]|uniref:Phosrestin-2-like n=1 Tax=Galendromus occidentalis TaxID=34638 RepID=A0AAJ7L3Q0_9ACAR|nr:phosrestin-2-like [Galendromus occidentalis]